MKSSSIILTVHNKAWLLPKSLKAIQTLTNWDDTEIIFVVDGCTDDSLKIIREWCRENVWDIETTVMISNNVFETKANNIGIKESIADYVIIIQDDQIPAEQDWNVRLLEPFMKWSDVFAVSAGCAHNWEYNIENKGSDINGWSDLLNHIHHANKSNTERDIFAVRDSCNRGPLAIKLSDMYELCCFDEMFSPQDSDDHDLMYRAKKELNKMCGFYHVCFVSEAAWGGTRNEDGSTKQWMLDANKKNAALLYERHKDVMHNHVIENRYI